MSTKNYRLPSNQLENEQHSSLSNRSSLSIKSSTSGQGESHQRSFAYDTQNNSESMLKPMATSTPSIPSAASNPGHSFSDSRPRKSLPGSVLPEDILEDKERSYKAQRKSYLKEKQRVTSELYNAINDPSVVIISGVLKVRGKLKGWSKLWAVLKPGLLLLYKSNKIKSSHWVATVLLNCCKIIQRPTKKEGFCFKVFHPLEHSIWALKGPEGETSGAVVQPLPTTYLICRARTPEEGKYWMDGLEVALTCSSLLVRSPRSSSDLMEEKYSTDLELETGHDNGLYVIPSVWNDDISEGDEKIPSDVENDSNNSVADEDNQINIAEVSDEDQIERHQKHRRNSNKSFQREICNSVKKSTYILNSEEFSTAKGEHSEELADENKSLLWFLIKQVRPGMDLSRVVLPTFILEPRSFLDKLSDYYYHADYLSKAVQEDDPFTRMKYIVRWYLSGFYKKPKGLKKPYNPILGETFRCMWTHPNGSKTFYIAEQVSHHPPVSAFYVSNKKEGFVISAAITAKSKFYGNSTSAILDGIATLTLLPRGETYTMTMPFAHCKGILLGTLSMELGGNVTIACINTGYFTDLEFKLKSFLSRSDQTNGISGKMKLGRETLAHIDGHWDNKIIFKDKKTMEEEILWEVNEEVKSSRLIRYTIPLEDQNPTESEKLWLKVSEAISQEDQETATIEKTILEERQRQDVRDRASRNEDWAAQCFVHDGKTWKYRYEDLRPWDDRNDISEYEADYVISTERKLDTIVVTSGSSLVSLNASHTDLFRDAPVSDKILPSVNQLENNRQLVDLLKQLLTRQIYQSEQIEQLKEGIAKIEDKLKNSTEKDPFRTTHTILIVIFAISLQLFMIVFWFHDSTIIN